jgi:ribulose-phosphate 3-epimerase
LTISRFYLHRGVFDLVHRRSLPELAAAGADTFVAGSAIFNAPDYQEVIAKMRAELALARP